MKMKASWAAILELVNAVADSRVNEGVICKETSAPPPASHDR
jgi:hypothetical protein